MEDSISQCSEYFIYSYMLFLIFDVLLLKSPQIIFLKTFSRLFYAINIVTLIS